MNARDVGQRPGQVVFTNKARCRDCYRCLRACPVKAIRIVDGQAFVDPDRCIACGTCIRECPQEAKSFRNDVDRAMRIIGAGGPVAATLAPSFAAYFPPDQRGKLPAALRALGFAHVAETAIGAYAVGRGVRELVEAAPDACHICTACPAVVSYVEQYEPDLAPNLTPVVSPMVAHAREIKQRIGDSARVIFIGPCVAKKAEAELPEHSGLVDCVLTFAELEEWFNRADISIDAYEERPFDEQPGGDARFFPLPGGLARTASLTTDLLGMDTLAVSGIEELRQGLDVARGARRPMLIEPLFCPQGCVNGPGMPAPGNMYARRADLLDYARTHEGGAPSALPGLEALRRQFGARRVGPDSFPEEAIQEVLEQTGKGRTEDQLNCGACGYDSCRAKAVAVLEGMAAPEMCIPFMRRLAEQRSDKIIDTTPNGVVILDAHLRILHMNRAFRAMFQATDGSLGRHISYLMDPEPFERALGTRKEKLELTARHDTYGLVCHEIIYPLPDEQQYVGIFVNITSTMTTQQKLKRLRSETVLKAQQLLEHQVAMAQELATFLGESTARSEELVRNIQSMASEKPKEPGDNWLWDTDTST